MRWHYNNRDLFKYIFIFVAAIIVTGSLWVSHHLVSDLSKEERQKIELWAEATRMAGMADENTDLDLIFQIISSNTTIPVILCNAKDSVISSANIELPEEGVEAILNEKVKEFKSHHPPIILEDPNFTQYVYYDDSYTLKNLQIYPYVQIGILAIFVITSFLALLSTQKAEQNKVWVGLSKETAHQLGTPISSLLAWSEYLKLKDVDSTIVNEIEKDVNRLQMIADRFSKIGSAPNPQPVVMQDAIHQSVGYLEKRISKKVKFTFSFPDTPIFAEINDSLFSWVIENISKNAVDAMEGQGEINFALSEKGNTTILDITDTGKGISKSKFKTVFSPGYTTKKRGWGLGLSLVKRIIESYHNGKIYVQWSELNVGTTFRIELKNKKKNELEFFLN